MVLYIGMAGMGAWWYFWSQPVANPSAAPALTLTFSSVFALRILLMTTPWGYAIFYDGPAILSILLLARAFVPQWGGSRRLSLPACPPISTASLTPPLVNTHAQCTPPLHPPTH